MRPRIVQHFILTRFNLLLWTKDKAGNKVRSKKWLKHRFALFEKYCLLSIVNQTCKDFEWIVLFDNTTPEQFKERIKNLHAKCPQMTPVFVEPAEGRYFAQIFRNEVVKRLPEIQEFRGRVLTTYLDNDDALDRHFVEDIQRRSVTLEEGTFICYDDGYQFFTDYQYMMRVHFPRNHFMSVVEERNLATLKTIYGYGSHYYIDKIEGVKIERIKDQPMWCEVVHEKNMGNDAYLLNAKMVKAADGFSFMFQDSGLRYGLGIYFFRFLPRYVKTFVRRVKIKLRGYRFE